MSRADAAQASAEDIRSALHAGMKARRAEIEQGLLTRIYAVSDSLDATDPEYTDGLRSALSAAVDYALAAVELGDRRPLAIPATLFAQARLAARNGIGLDTVLRRYCAGYALLGDFLIEEAGERGFLGGAALQGLMRSQAVLFDRLLGAVSEEYRREAASRVDNAEQRRAARVRGLLDGELLDTSDLSYDFGGHHLGVVVSGTCAETVLRDLAASADRSLLSVRTGDEAQWAWLGGRNRIDPHELERLSRRGWPTRLTVAIGEPAEGLAGWRLTHRQARAALPVALRRRERFVRYADVALLASMLQDDLLVASLRQLYLEPLDIERDGGEMARRTLRSYFAAERNVSSAAAALRVTRQAVARRLRLVEEQLGRSMGSCGTELEVALQLDDLHSV